MQPLSSEGERADYAPFGEAEVTTALISNDLRFPGQLFDEESGLHYNYFRDYDPGLGRYISSDPLGVVGGLATFVYANATPMSEVDPYGLVPGLGGRSARAMDSLADLLSMTRCQLWPGGFDCLFACVRYECSLVTPCGRVESYFVGQSDAVAHPGNFDPGEFNCRCVSICAKSRPNCVGLPTPESDDAGRER